jgi:hypothetical protein
MTIFGALSSSPALSTSRMVAAHLIAQHAERQPFPNVPARPVSTESLILVDDVMESPLMSVVNSRGNKLFSPRGDVPTMW